VSENVLIFSLPRQRPATSSFRKRWQVDLERSPLTWLADNLNSAAVRFDNLTALVQANTETLLFGGLKGLKKPVADKIL
jgi:hypothetical protein